MERSAKILLGAMLGALGGAILGGARTCSSDACKVRGPRWYYIIACAFFGAAVAFSVVD